MAIKERLLKQLNIVQDGLNAMPPFHSRDLNAMRNALVQARDLCFQGLSEKSFAEYKDTYDGLLLAVDQLTAGAADSQEIASLCGELLQYLSVQTQKETAFKKEIFFLPYKASMWDSLESVWRAAAEDKEHCIAYVMPIPYADLTPKHTVAEWHCERELFPADVPTVKWEDVDLEEWHPDVIFIHNPYDEYNRVTSVDSRYYSSNLKKCTDKLVYIPYFVLDEIEPGNETAEEGISGFVLTPAVLNADEVIVQSEGMRQAYINVLLRNTDQKDRTYWEKRILGLGSPKIDKVLASKKEDFELPEVWAKIVKGKKVILYNTSLNAMLQNSDKVCEKLRRVFGVFKGCDDVALWWRPHPLMKATIHSMRPEIEKEYCKIEQKYIEEGWGVYDDTVDLHRAIIFSDAYYGDGSSVVTLYQRTSKPIMIQNLNFPDSITPPQVYVIGSAGLISAGILWLVSDYANLLMKIDLRQNKLVAYYSIPEKLHDHYPCLSLVLFDHTIYLVPYSLYNIWAFDIEKGVFARVEWVSDEESVCLHQIRQTILLKDCIYFVGDNMEGITSFSLSTGTVHKYGHCLEQLCARKVLNTSFFRNRCLLDSTVAYFPISNSSTVVSFDLATHILKIHAIGDSNKAGIDVIEKHGYDFVLRNTDGERILWNPATGVKEISYDYFIRRCRNPSYMSPLYHNNNIVYFGAYDEKIGIRKIEENEIYSLPFEQHHNWDADGYGKFGFIAQDNENIYFQMTYDGNFYILNMTTLQFKKVEIVFPDELLHEIKLNILSQQPIGIWREDRIVRLGDFILRIKHDFSEETREKNYPTKAGASILIAGMGFYEQ